MKKIACFLLICLCTLATSCAETPREPEQVYLVSALGFDGGEMGYRISVEVPLIGEKNGIASKVLCGEGATVEEALFQVTEGLSKELIYSHCALLILGNSLSRQQLVEVFAFAGNGEHIPLEARTVCADSAETLLSADGNFTTAAGYEIPEIFKRTCESLGVRLRYAIYELRADAPNGVPIPIPLFGLAEGEQATAFLRGLRILRPNEQPLDLSVGELLPFSLLTNRFRGENGGAVSAYPPMEHGKTDMTVDLREGHLCFVLQIHARSAVPLSEEIRVSTEKKLVEDTVALFTRFKAEAGDPLGLTAVVRQSLPELYDRIMENGAVDLSTAECRVQCNITGEVRE